MKFVYFHSLTGNQNSGVEKKVLSQLQHLRTLGVDAKLLLTNETSTSYPNYSYIIEKPIHLNRALQMVKLLGIVWREKLKVDILKESDIFQMENGVLYIRSPYPSLHLWLLLRRPHNVKIITEHQTIEWKEYKLQKKYSYLIADLLFGRSIRRDVDGLIGVTCEITQYQLKISGNLEKAHMTIGNGFDIHSAPLRNSPWFDGLTLNLLFVANVRSWHGLDRLLQGLATYSGTPRVVLHIVGDGAELSHLQKLTIDLGITDRVIFHGFLTGKSLDTLFDQCHVAVGSLGIHRKGLTQTSELKAREYCARGIPYVIAVSDPDFPEDFPYIFHLPADESPIDVEKVLAFAKRVCEDPDHPQKMRCYAEEHLDWSVKMKKLKGFLETLVGENGGAGIPGASISPHVVKGREVPRGATLPGAVQGDVTFRDSGERRF